MNTRLELRRRRRWVSAAPFLVVAFVMAVVLAGCGGGPDLTQPPELRIGRDICTECGMTIDSCLFAAGYFDADGSARHFDDLGDLLQYVRKQEVVPEPVWVYDYETCEPVIAGNAAFVVSPLINAPHHGIAAFKAATATDAFVREVGGRVISWPELLELDLTEAVNPDLMLDHDDH